MINLGNPARPALLAAARSEKLENLVRRTPITKPVVKRFIPGDDQDEMLHAVRELFAAGHAVSIDFLGEDIHTRDEAQATVTAYETLLTAYGHSQAHAGDGPQVATHARKFEVSIKLSALGQSLPDGGNDFAIENAHRICTAADAVGAWVNVDAEDHTVTDPTLAAVRELRREHPTVATVLQAYLRRTEDDCREFATAGSRIRLCKGAYQEPAEVAFQAREEVDASYLRCLKVLMAGEGYPMVASHDPAMVSAAQQYATEAGRDKTRFEHQMLYGIRPDEQDRLAAEGYTMRTYVPYGDDWYGYFMRRLAERPANLKFFLRSLAGRG